MRQLVLFAFFTFSSQIISVIKYVSASFMMG